MQSRSARVPKEVCMLYKYPIVLRHSKSEAFPHKEDEIFSKILRQSY